MRPRFFVPTLDPERGEAVLPGDESRHLVRVLRLGPGAHVEVFDGSGREFAAEVVTAGRSGVTVRLRDAIERSTEPRVRVVLAQAILKPASMDDVVRDATMMGVGAIVPLVTDHVTVPARAIAGGRAVERWRRIALASVKQCRRASLPHIHEPTPFDAWLADASGIRGAGPTLFLVEPLAVSTTRSLRSVMDDPAPRAVTIAVGPEGGWSEEETAAALAAGCTPVSLGPLTLRADAAALVALSGLAVVWSG